MNYKKILNASDLVVLLCGIGMLGTGVYSLSLSHQMSFIATGIPTMILLLSIATMTIAFIGIYSNVMDIPSTIPTTFVVFFIVILIQIVLGSYTLARKSGVELDVSAFWGLQKPEDLIVIEQSFQCCGFSSITDRAVPNECLTVYGFTVPCGPKIIPLVQSNMTYVAGDTLLLAAIEAVALAVGMWAWLHITGNIVIGESRQFPEASTATA